MRSILVLIALAASLCAQPLPVSTPEKEGLSTERLGRLHRYFDSLSASGHRAGAVTMIVRNGRIADWKTFGQRDIEQRLPMEKDTIFRIYSMTKVITSVAAMMLVEEGKLRLNDPVDKYAPALKTVRVFQGGTAADPQLVPPTRPMTIKHLLTHTSGLTYGWGRRPVDEIIRKANIFDVPTLDAFVSKMAGLPLVAHPGEKYEYGVSTDVLGYVVQMASGMPFDQFLKSRLFEPLRMNDTFFQLPEDRKARAARIYTTKEGKLVTDSSFAVSPLAWGGMGLYSTIGDYARFAQMLLNGGELDGKRILSRKTVELMTQNHLNDLADPTTGGSKSEGFGLGGAVRIDLAKSNNLGSLGQFGWAGAASTYFRIDPKEKAVVLLFMQYMPYDTVTLDQFATLAYQSIVD